MYLSISHLPTYPLTYLYFYIVFLKDNENILEAGCVCPSSCEEYQMFIFIKIYKIKIIKLRDRETERIHINNNEC